MGRDRRRGSRRRERLAREAAEREASPPGDGRRRASGGREGRSRPGWRRTIDAWGGLTVVGSVLVAIVAVGALIVLNRPGSSVNDDPYVPVARAHVDGKTWGVADAPIRIIEFADFQCPFCARFSLETEPQLADEFIATGTVQFSFRHYAFLGPESLRAAEAAECANDQGRFWDYHDLLFLRQGRENSGAFSSDQLKDFARELRDAFSGFDVDAFDACLDSGAKRVVVEQATAEAEQAGITQTPSFLINGKLLTGAQEIDVFREAVRQELAAARGAGAGS